MTSAGRLEAKEMPNRSSNIASLSSRTRPLPGMPMVPRMMSVIVVGEVSNSG